jgi:hypothetical protein
MQIEEMEGETMAARIEAETTVIAVTSNRYRKPESGMWHDITVARAISRDRSSSMIAPGTDLPHRSSRDLRHASQNMAMFIIEEAHVI